MKRFGFLILFGLGLTSQLLSAQNSRPEASSARRYLFVVETSSAMQYRAKAIQEAVQAMLRYDLNGQLRPGDTLGIWTFNEELYAGRFPLQLWMPGHREAVAQAVVEFLKKQRYEKRARLESVLPELERLTKTSGAITVLLVSTGEGEIRGTPFDQEINATHGQWRREMQRMRMPFITVLRARNGHFVSHTVNMAPWPVEFPAFPPELEPAVAVLPPQDAPAKKTEHAPPPKLRAPIILDMSKLAKDAAKEPDTTERTTTGQSPAPSVPAAETPLPKVDLPEAPQAAPVAIPVPRTEPPPAVPSPGVTPPPAAVTTPVAAPLTGEAASIERANQQLEQKTAELETKRLRAAPAEPAAPGIEKPAPGLATPKAASPAPPPASQGKLAPAQTAVREPIRPPGNSDASARSQTEAPPAPPTARGQIAVTTPPGALSSVKALLIAAAVLVVGVLGLLLLRRARAAPHASLITRSMERKEK